MTNIMRKHEQSSAMRWAGSLLSLTSLHPVGTSLYFSRTPHPVISGTRYWRRHRILFSRIQTCKV